MLFQEVLDFLPNQSCVAFDGLAFGKRMKGLEDEAFGHPETPIKTEHKTTNKQPKHSKTTEDNVQKNSKYSTSVGVWVCGEY